MKIETKNLFNKCFAIYLILIFLKKVIHSSENHEIQWINDG